MSLAAKLPWTHRYARGFPGINGSQTMPTDADAVDYLTRVAAADGAGVEVSVAVAVDEFFADAKELGVFSSIRSSCILAGARTLAGALVPMVGDAGTPNGFVSGDYSRTNGLGDSGGTSYFITGLPYNEVSANNEHLALYITSLPGSENLVGGGSLSPACFSRIGYSGGQQRYDLQTGTGLSVGAPFSIGFIGGSRSSSAEVTRRNAGSSVTAAAASATRSTTTTPYGVFCSNYSTLPGASPTTATIAFYSIGTSLSLEDLDTAVTNLIARLKFAFLTGENPAPYDIDTVAYVVRGYENGGTLQ